MVQRPVDTIKPAAGSLKQFINIYFSLGDEDDFAEGA